MKHLFKTTLQTCTFLFFGTLLTKDEIIVTAQVSMGELLDKITILENKEKRIKSDKKRANVSRELTTLTTTFAQTYTTSSELAALVDTLRHINETLWDLEDATRLKEANHTYDTEFKQLAATIIDRNDARARTKYAINILTNSAIVEEKSYKEMEGKASSAEKSSLISIEIPFAELIDKITILEVKLEKITDEQKKRHITAELELLCQTRNHACTMTAELEHLTTNLRTANRTMFDIQDAIRTKIRADELDDEFVRLARSVYFTNDERCSVKLSINKYMGSHLVEEKEYTAYGTSQASPA
jgi:hypothetical protein